MKNFLDFVIDAAFAASLIIGVLFAGYLLFCVGLAITKASL